VTSSDRSGTTSRCLNRIKVRLRQKIRLAGRMTGRMVELDIAACRIERDIAANSVRNGSKINEELSKVGMTESDWRTRELGYSIQTMAGVCNCVLRDDGMLWVVMKGW
jgi:hypothetical protein